MKQVLKITITVDDLDSFDHVPEVQSVLDNYFGISADIKVEDMTDEHPR